MTEAALAATSVALVAGALLALLASVFIRRELTPVVAPRVSARWVPWDEKLVVLTIEVENLSRVRVQKGAIVLRVREHDPTTGLDGHDAVCLGTEWVTLGSPWVERREETGAHCSLGSCEIFESTVFLNPTETIRVQRLYEVGESGVIHVGLQVRNRFPWWVEQLDGLTRLWNFQLPVNQRSGLSRQQTSTWYICREG
jgi:hypothetical protein